MAGREDHPRLKHLGPSSIHAALAALFVLAGLALRAVLPLNPDLIWLAHLATQRLAGVEVYRQFVELNPPTAWWIHLPAAAAAATFGTPLSTATHIQTVCLILALALAGLALIPRPYRARVSPWLAFAAVLLPGLQFGQRDHLVGLLFVPAAVGLVQAGRTETSSRGRNMLIGALLGFACGLKPHYLPAAIFLLAPGGNGRPSGWNRAGVAAMALVGALLAAAALVLEPGYLRVVKDYGALYAGWHRADLLDYLKPVALVAIAASLALVGKAGGGRVIILLSLLLAGAVLQGKGFAYHYLPAATVSIILTPLLLQTERSSRVIPVAIVALLALWSLAADGASLVHRRRAWTEMALGEVPAGTSVLILSHVVGSSWPSVIDHGWEWTSSFASSWWLESIIQHHGGRWCAEGRVRVRDLTAYERRALERAVADIVGSPPDVILTYWPIRRPDGSCVQRRRWNERDDRVRSYQVGALDVLATDRCALMRLGEYAESTDPGSEWRGLRRRPNPPALPPECDLSSRSAGHPTRTHRQISPRLARLPYISIPVR